MHSYKSATAGGGFPAEIEEAPLEAGRLALTPLFTTLSIALLSPVYRGEPQRGRGASGDPESVPPRRVVQIAPMLARVRARNTSVGSERAIYRYPKGTV